ncbi:MAG: hypothetical protein U5L11_15155 [Arhodomonas sp.]|nr:hypothetical protein [Arhodomonas sp.]
MIQDRVRKALAAAAARAAPALAISIAAGVREADISRWLGGGVAGGPRRCRTPPPWSRPAPPRCMPTSM